MKRWLRVAIFVAVTAAVVIAARRVDWARALQLIGGANPGWIAAALVANAGILACWAAFWRALLPPGVLVPFRRMFEIVSTSSSLMNTVPFGGGHASSILVLANRGPIGHGDAVSVFALDQLGEGVTKIGMFLLAAWLVPLPVWMRAGIASASLLVGTLFVVLVVVSRYRAELALLRSWRRVTTALSCVIAMKAVQGLGMAAVQHAFGLDVGATGTLLVLAAVVLGTMVPLAPANLGTYEASAFLAYRHLGLSPERALTLAIVQHACFMLPAVGVGYAYVSRRTLSRSAVASP